MGNKTSTSKSNESETDNSFTNFYNVLDYIATYYIMTMNFKSLKKLNEKEYCDKLVILTSDIIEKYFNDTEIKYLQNRIKNGVEVNEMNKEKIIFFNKENLESMDISNDTQKTIRKKRVCIGIAKYYIKIAHIFAAIITTINPVYLHKDASGKMVKTTLLEKDKIPANIDKKLFKLNICDNRIHALKRGEKYDINGENVNIHPKTCDVQLNNSTEKDTVTLQDEPGIPELLMLYFDDNYDYSNGTFTGMSESTQKQFMSDLKTFYTAFTGVNDMPSNITKFSDIKLRNYTDKKKCVNSGNFVISKNDKLFISYADNIKNMIHDAYDNQHKLLSVINEIFVYVNDPFSNKKVIRINPKLTDELLQKIVEKTRKIIIDLYVKCESDYVTGIKIYEAIIETKILETTKKQIDVLKQEANKIAKNISIGAVPDNLSEQYKPRVNRNNDSEYSWREPSLTDNYIQKDTPRPIMPIANPVFSNNVVEPISMSTVVVPKDTSKDTSTIVPTAVPINIYKDTSIVVPTNISNFNS
jgi:hypothetical protein